MPILCAILLIVIEQCPKYDLIKRTAEEALSRVRVQIAAGEFVRPEERRRQEALKPDIITFEDFAVSEFLPSLVSYAAFAGASYKAQKRI